MEAIDQDKLTQINLINYRANSLESLTDLDSKESNIKPIMSNWYQKIIKSTSMSEDNKKVAHIIFNIMKDYQVLRKTVSMNPTHMKLSINRLKSLKDEVLFLKKSQKWFNESWLDIANNLPRVNYIISKLEMMDMIQYDVTDTQALDCPKLCSQMPILDQVKTSVSSKLGFDINCAQSKNDIILVDCVQEDKLVNIPLCKEMSQLDQAYNQMVTGFGYDRHCLPEEEYKIISRSINMSKNERVLLAKNKRNWVKDAEEFLKSNKSLKKPKKVFNYMKTNTKQIAKTPSLAYNENDRLMKTTLANLQNLQLMENKPSSLLKNSSMENLKLKPEARLVENEAENQFQTRNQFFMKEKGRLEGALRAYYGVSHLTFFEKLAEVYRDKGIAMELNINAVELFEKIPSFVDGKALNSGVDFLDNFERSKAVT